MLNLKTMNLDKWRLIASFLVVAIHIYPFISLNEEFDFLFTHVFCRIAVPFFLMITGYFVLPASLKDKHTLITYSKKIIGIYAICILVYLPINIYAGTFNDASIVSILKDIFINGTFYHLWYFPALVLGLWVSYFMVKYWHDYIVKFAVFFLFLIGIFGDSYYGLSSRVDVLASLYNFLFTVFDYTRNGLFYVPIFLYLGYYFHHDKSKKLVKTNLLLLFISLFLMEIEGFFLHQYKLQKHDSMYLFLLPVMYFLFSLVLQKNVGSNSKLRKLSTIIYIVHPFMIIGLRGIAKVTHLERILIGNSIICYLCVCLLSLIFSLVFIKVKEIIRQWKKEQVVYKKLGG